jgi:glycosyltransferase involved in cell wall biosynthesis
MKICELSVVIPCFNSLGYLSSTLEALHASIEASGLSKYEVILVDDGSTDGLSQKTFEATDFLIYLQQPNSGRLQARLAGLKEAKYDNVLLIDSRVTLGSSSLNYLIQKYDSGVFVSGPTEFPRDVNLVGVFWSAISRLAWWRFYRLDGPFLLATHEFNQLPKGTTCLFGPRKKILEETIKLIDSDKLISKFKNDDTSLIRNIVNDSDFWVDKKFFATYHPRQKIKDFIGHTYHRGQVFYDGFPQFRFFIAAFMVVLSLVFGYLILAFGLKSLLIYGVALAGAHLLVCLISRYRKLPFKETASLLSFGFLFFLVYLLGFFRALARRSVIK